MQTQKYEVEATEKQISFIKNLQKKGFIDVEVDIENLNKREASSIIDAGLAKAKRKALQEEESTDEFEQVQTIEGIEPEPIRKKLSQKDNFDPIRFGLCVKLVYNKHEHGMANAKGVANFKEEVKQLYQIITDLEREFQSSLSFNKKEAD